LTAAGILIRVCLAAAASIPGIGRRVLGDLRTPVTFRRGLAARLIRIGALMRAAATAITLVNFPSGRSTQIIRLRRRLPVIRYRPSIHRLARSGRLCRRILALSLARRRLCSPPLRASATVTS
jgi:hypothetical protein